MNKRFGVAIVGSRRQLMILGSTYTLSVGLLPFTYLFI